MNIINSIHHYVRQLINHKSKIDGRMWLATAVFTYFGMIYLANLFVPYQKIWVRLGVPAMSHIFADLEVVLGGFECDRLSGNISLENSCFPRPPIYYPRAWSLLTGLGFDKSDTVFLGILFALLFYAITLIIIGRLNSQEAILYSLVLCSPPVILLIERSNVDIIVYSFLGLGLIAIQKNQGLITRCCVYFLIFFLGVLKIFPIFGLAVILREKRSNFLIFLTILTTAFLTYYIYNLGDMKAIPEYFSRRVGSHAAVGFGYKILLFKIQGFLSKVASISSASDIKKIFKIVFYILASSSIMLIFIRVLLGIYNDFKKWLNSDFLSKNLIQSLDKSQCQYIDYFRLGSGIYIGIFLLVGRASDYKLAFIIFVIPQILAWIKGNNELSLPSTVALVCIVGTLYTSPFLYPWGVDEIINWLLCLTLLYILILSFPKWLKSLIYSNCSGGIRSQ